MVHVEAVQSHAPFIFLIVVLFLLPKITKAIFNVSFCLYFSIFPKKLSFLLENFHFISQNMLFFWLKMANQYILLLLFCKYESRENDIFLKKS